MSREKQSQYDRMTGQPAEKLILELGLPTTISMLVTNLYNMADTFLCVGVAMLMIYYLFLDDSALFGKNGKKELSDKQL